MIHSSWRKRLAAVATAAALVGGVVQAQAPAEGPSVIVLREPGQPERRCKIEQTIPQADGSILLLVSDLATGEQLRVKDNRRRKTEMAKVVARINGPDAATVAMTGPASANNSMARRVPTNAELASGQPLVLPAAVMQQIHDLHEALGPSQREMAAMALASCDCHRAPEVTAALMQAAQSDPAPSVRLCLARCLLRISGEVPDVVPVLAKMQQDADAQVQGLAREAMVHLTKQAK